jgi:hypothetical protein
VARGAGDDSGACRRETKIEAKSGPDRRWKQCVLTAVMKGSMAVKIFVALTAKIPSDSAKSINCDLLASATSAAETSPATEASAAEPSSSAESSPAKATAAGETSATAPAAAATAETIKVVTLKFATVSVLSFAIGLIETGFARRVLSSVVLPRALLTLLRFLRAFLRTGHRIPAAVVVRLPAVTGIFVNVAVVGGVHVPARSFRRGGIAISGRNAGGSAAG